MEVYTPDFEPLLSRDDDRIPEGLFTKETHMCGSLRLYAPHEGILSLHFPAWTGVGTSPKKIRHPDLPGLRLTRGLGVVDSSRVPYSCKSIYKIHAVSDEIETV